MKHFDSKKLAKMSFIRFSLNIYSLSYVCREDYNVS